jgi:hypothetical protein
MTENKRTPEAASLRTFFNEQMRHLHDLLEHVIAADSEPVADEELQVVEDFVDAANKKLRVVQGYAEKLRSHVCLLHRHVLDVAAQIPPPIELTPTALQAEPLINALFVERRDIDQLFHAHGEVKSYVRQHNGFQVPVIYALLTASKTEKSILGVGMLGDLLVRDLPQQTINFHSHQLHAPSADSDGLVAGINSFLFQRVVMLIQQGLAARMAVETNWPRDKTYQARVNSLTNPEIYLHELMTQLENPEQLLRIEKNHLLLNKLGIKINPNDDQCRNEFDIHEIIWSDQSRHIVLKIAYLR